MQKKRNLELITSLLSDMAGAMAKAEGFNQRVAVQALIMAGVAHAYSMVPDRKTGEEIATELAHLVNQCCVGAIELEAGLAEEA